MASALVAGMLLCSLSGCSTTDKKDNHNDVNTSTDDSEIYVEKEGLWTEDMEQLKENVTMLHVDSEKKNAFLKKYGEDIYYSALSLSVNFLLLNSNSTVSDNSIQGLKSQYDVKLLNLESSFNGHKIPADYITSETENRDTVILVHGQGCWNSFSFTRARLQYPYI